MANTIAAEIRNEGGPLAGMTEDPLNQTIAVLVERLRHESSTNLVAAGLLRFNTVKQIILPNTVLGRSRVAYACNGIHSSAGQCGGTGLFLVCEPQCEALL